MVEATSKNVQLTVDNILSNLKKSLSEFFPNTETYFTLLCTKLKKGMVEAYNQYQKKVEDERNRLII